MPPIFSFHRGSVPLLISVPHAGTFVPEEILKRFSIAGASVPDTDWHVDKLYACARDIGASMIVANYSRYVVDLNRAPDSAPLYPDVPITPVCPVRTFNQDPIYLGEDYPPTSEIGERVARYWRPYHDAIAEELQRMLEVHGRALLWDGHSVASEMPSLFHGVLPEFNLGSRDDSSCPREITDRLLDYLTRDGAIGAVLNGRFKGGFITEHYGRPERRVYAVQLEIAQRTYMDEAKPGEWAPTHAQRASELIRGLLSLYLESALAP